MKAKIFFITSILSLSLVATAFSTLLTVSNDIVYDNVHNQYWIRDLGAISEKITGSVSGAIHYLNDIPPTIEYLNNSFSSQNWGDWRLAPRNDINNLLENSLPDIFSNFIPQYAWDDPSPIDHEELLFGMFDSGSSENKDVLGVYWLHSHIDSMITDTYNIIWSDEHNFGFGASGWFVADAVPVPEPAAGVFLCIGMVILYHKIRRRQL